MKRAAVLLPGRGSYGESSLGSLPPDHPRVRAAEGLRTRYGLEPLLALDGAPRFEPSRHLRPAHASALVLVASLLDAERALAEHEVVAVGGNSLGWYTALVVARALSFEDGFRLVQEMALLQEEGAPGGQVIHPVVDEDWRPSPERAAQVERALAEMPGELFPSIHLGGHEVLAGTDRGVAHLMRVLPECHLGRTRFPLRLAQHGPYHTPLAADVARRAREALADLDFRRPRIALVDGRGVRWSPWSTDPARLRDYTLGTQVETPFDFTRCVRVVLREHAPDRLVLPGPGNTLGGICGQILAREGWRGIHAKADFERVQESEDPIVVSMRAGRGPLGAVLRRLARVLDETAVPWQVVGGLAARAHGAARPLVDVDLYVPASRLAEVEEAFRHLLVRPASHHRDEHWDLAFLALEIDGWRVEVAAADGARFRDAHTDEWLDAAIDFASSERRTVDGVEVPVQARVQLVDQKRRLDRDVDRADVAELEGR